MILLRLVGGKYYSYVLLASLFWAALYTLVDVLEKIARYSQHIALHKIVRYAGITFIPNFILLFPLSILLGLLLFLREWIVRDYLLSMLVCGISPRHIAALILFFSGCAAGGIFMLHETIGYRLARSVTEAKTALLGKALYAPGWFRYGADSFVLIRSKDLMYVLKGGGKPALCIVAQQESTNQVLNQKFSFHQGVLTQGDSACIDTSKLDLLAYSALENSMLKNFSMITTPYGQRLILDLLFFLFKIFLFPMFAVMLFFTYQQHQVFRWVCIAIPYAALNVLYATTQLLGILTGFGIFLMVTMILFGYLWKRMR
ncbi:LptF/LptG family permease [Candidatus Dependentiae bacterium]|nr:LptF/LptG family permease [Candidatus Dependentiae bacterium]